MKIQILFTIAMFSSFQFFWAQNVANDSIKLVTKTTTVTTVKDTIVKVNLNDNSKALNDAEKIAIKEEAKLLKTKIREEKRALKEAIRA